MAGEIIVLDGNGRDEYNIALLFPIAAPEQVSGANVVPTPAPEAGSLLAQCLTTLEKDALNAGTLAYEIISFQKAAAATALELTARVQEIYTQRRGTFNAWYANRYQFVGTRRDAP